MPIQIITGNIISFEEGTKDILKYVYEDGKVYYIKAYLKNLENYSVGGSSIFSHVNYDVLHNALRRVKFPYVISFFKLSPNEIIESMVLSFAIEQVVSTFSKKLGLSIKDLYQEIVSMNKYIDEDTVFLFVNDKVFLVKDPVCILTLRDLRILYPIPLNLHQRQILDFIANIYVRYKKDKIIPITPHADIIHSIMFYIFPYLKMYTKIESDGIYVLNDYLYFIRSNFSTAERIQCHTKLLFSIKENLDFRPFFPDRLVKVDEYYNKQTYLSILTDLHNELEVKLDNLKKIREFYCDKAVELIDNLIDRVLKTMATFKKLELLIK